MNRTGSPHHLLERTRPWLGLVLGAAVALAACQKQTPVEMYVAGFDPERVRFEVEDQGVLDRAAVDAIDARPDIDGVLRLPDDSCPSAGCRTAIISVFVHNKGQPNAPAQEEAPPVVRLKSPSGKPERLPVFYRGKTMEPGRIGRVRFAVELWPDETTLTATLSSSVFLVADPTAARPAPSALDAPTTNSAAPHVGQ